MRTAFLVALMALAPLAAHGGRLGVVRPTRVGEIAGRQLPDWRQSGTGSATQLDRVCDALVVEAILSGESQHNFLNLSVANPTDGPVSLSVDQVMVHFSNELVRRLMSAEGKLIIRPDQVASVPLAFPDKADFRGQEWMTIEVPALIGERACTFEVRFRRNPLVPERAATTSTYRLWELGVALGPSFATHGPLTRVTPSVGWGGDFNLAIFPWPAHGFTFDLVIHGWGADAARKVVPGVTGSNVELDDFGLLTGYAFRTYPLSWLTVSLEAAGGIAWSAVTGDNVVRSHVYPEVQVRARLLAPIWDFGYAGLVIDYARFLGGNLGTTDLSGGAFTATVALGLGY
jgi:hypothetical protein